MRFHSRFLYRAFTKLAKIFNPAKKHTMVIPEGFISPDLKFISIDEVKIYIDKYKKITQIT